VQIKPRLVNMAQSYMAFTTLVTVDALKTHLTDPQWVIFDCRFRLADPQAGLRAYQAGHIPGARYADLERDLCRAKTVTTGRHPLPKPPLLADKLGQWGVDVSKQVVVYDDNTSAIAARMWWLLHWLGHAAVAVLDGGLAAWKEQGGLLETTTPHPIATRFVARPNESMWVRTRYLEERLHQHEDLLLDARAPERFRGEQEPLDPVAGHIPGAVNRPLERNLDANGKFLPASVLRAAFSDLTETKSPMEVIHTCGSGVTACHNLLAMEIAGLSGSRLYPGSWSEWIRDPKHPVATGG